MHLYQCTLDCGSFRIWLYVSKSFKRRNKITNKNLILPDTHRFVLKRSGGKMNFIDFKRPQLRRLDCGQQAKHAKFVWPSAVSKHRRCKHRKRKKKKKEAYINETMQNVYIFSKRRNDSSTVINENIILSRLRFVIGMPAVSDSSTHFSGCFVHFWQGLINQWFSFVSCVFYFLFFVCLFYVSLLLN